MAEKMEKVVVYTDRGAEWNNPLYDFDNPETLEAYLREAAPRGSYKISAAGIWATDAAIAAAQAALARDAEESRREMETLI